VTSTTEGAVTQARLSDGIAAFHVEHVGPGRRFLLALPDGELEVRGTRFVVSVQRERTESVEVREGVVALRLRGDRERSLGAGERWISPAAAEAAGDAPVESALPAAAANAPTMALNRRRAPAAPSSASGSGAHQALQSSTGPDAHAAERELFSAAVNSFGGGRYLDADLLFVSFIHDFPLDPRCEDASFLRAVAHLRMGDAAGAADLARAYLATFPHGLRRLEATDLAERTAR